MNQVLYIVLIIFIWQVFGTIYYYFSKDEEKTIATMCWMPCILLWIFSNIYRFIKLKYLNKKYLPCRLHRSDGFMYKDNVLINKDDILNLNTYDNIGKDYVEICDTKIKYLCFEIMSYKDLEKFKK